MSESQENSEDRKIKIGAQIAEMSRLLGMIPADDTIEIHGPLTQEKIFLSDWLRTTRDSFLKLSVLIGKELDIELQ